MWRGITDSYHSVLVQDCPKQCRGPSNFGCLSATFSSNWVNKNCTKFPKTFLGIVTEKNKYESTLDLVC